MYAGQHFSEFPCRKVLEQPKCNQLLGVGKQCSLRRNLLASPRRYLDQIRKQSEHLLAVIDIVDTLEALLDLPPLTSDELWRSGCVCLHALV